MVDPIDVERFKVAYLEEVRRGLDKPRWEEMIINFLDNDGKICDRSRLVPAIAEQSTRLAIAHLDEHYFGLPAHRARELQA